MDMYAALADPTRRTIIELLARNGQLPASTIYNKFQVSHPAISQHLKVLRQAKLVDVTKQGQQRLYQINPETLVAAEKWMHTLTTIWTERFDALDEVLAKEKTKLLKLKRKEV